MSLFQMVVKLGIPFSNHASDLYIPVTPETTKLLQSITIKGRKHHYSVFNNQVEGGLWYDVAFAYEPFWSAKLG